MSPYLFSVYLLPLMTPSVWCPGKIWQQMYLPNAPRTEWKPRLVWAGLCSTIVTLEGLFPLPRNHLGVTWGMGGSTATTSSVPGSSASTQPNWKPGVSFFLSWFVLSFQQPPVAMLSHWVPWTSAAKESPEMLSSPVLSGLSEESADLPLPNPHPK